MKTAPTARRVRQPLPIQAGDLRGLSQLGVDALLGVAGIAEGLHHTILSLTGPLGAVPEGRTGGITGLVYRSVQGGIRLAGQGLDAALALLPANGQASAQSLGASPAKPPTLPTPQREAFIAALNGVWGDHLLATGNPLAIAMQLRINGRPWREALQAGDAPAPGPHVLVLVHGLAMNDLQWAHQGHHHGEAVAAALGHSVLALHYNSGRHVSENGRDFSAQLDALLADWPVPIESLAIVGHSMGGLVARSACLAGAGRPWLKRLKQLVCLGTPHHGAPLEKGGRWVDQALAFSPYGAPFSKLGKARSAGITDLRFGNLQDADGLHRNRHTQAQDDRLPAPLPRGVKVCLVGATTAATTTQARGLRHALVGDGLVTLASALGEHADPARTLKLPARQRLVLTEANHWGLLSRPEVTAQLLVWLK